MEGGREYGIRGHEERRERTQTNGYEHVCAVHRVCSFFVPSTKMESLNYILILTMMHARILFVSTLRNSVSYFGEGSVR